MNMSKVSTFTGAVKSAAKSLAKCGMNGFVYAVGTLFAVSSANASIRNWDGDTSVTWATAGNWDTAPANDLTTDIANFNLATYGGNPVYAPNAGTVSINGVTVGASNGAMTLTTTTLSIGASGITIANGAGALTVSGAVTIGAAQSWSNSDNDVATFGVINHNGTVGTKLSLAGNFQFNGVNTGKGGININSGTLEIGSAGKLYGTYNNPGPVVTVGSGATLRVNGWGWDAAGGYGQLDATRQYLVVNGGTIEFAGNTSNVNAAADQNFTIGTGGATLKTTTAGQTWTLNLATTFGDLINNTGLTLGGAGNGLLAKKITGTGALTKTDGGTWTLSAATSTRTGNTTVSGGTLEISSAGKLYGAYDNAAVLTVNGGATLRVNGSGWDAVGGLGQLDWNVARLVLNGGTYEYAGNANADEERSFTIGANGATLKTTTAGRTWTIKSGAGNTGISNGSSLTVGGAGNGLISKIISGSGALTKTDGGTWTLTTNNTYTGQTTVSAGVLDVRVASSLSTSSAIQIDYDIATLRLENADNGGSVWTLAALKAVNSTLKAGAAGPESDIRFKANGSYTDVTVRKPDGTLVSFF